MEFQKTSGAPLEDDSWGESDGVEEEDKPEGEELEEYYYDEEEEQEV